MRFVEPVSRREFLNLGGLGIGWSALRFLDATSGLASDTSAETNPQATAISMSDQAWAKRPSHFPARAKHIIHLHMIGAPSQLDLFDEKPELVKRDGETCPEELLKGRRFAFIGGEMKLSGTRFKFGRHGVSGQPLSELLPQLGSVADDITVVRSIQTNEINHAPAQMFLHTGFGRGGRPSLGAWIGYGLGSENADLPGYVVLTSGPTGGAGANIWSSGFLPSVYQGISFRGTGEPVLFLNDSRGASVSERERVLKTIRSLNDARLAEVGDPEIATRIRQYELAFRMQMSVPELVDLASESATTLQQYGAEPGKPSFANNCLLARRLVERGVRYIQLCDSDWDHHADLATRLPAKCKDVDRPMAALVADLKQRGLLDETLVVWGAEFGRTPLHQGITGDGASTKPGRDHHKDAYSMWLAGGGVKPGLQYGRTDDFGFSVSENPVHIHDLNATILHLLGIDHERLTYKYQGREFRLTDVHGKVARDIVRS